MQTNFLHQNQRKHNIIWKLDSHRRTHSWLESERINIIIEGGWVIFFFFCLAPSSVIISVAFCVFHHHRHRAWAFSLAQPTVKFSMQQILRYTTHSEAPKYSVNVNREPAVVLKRPNKCTAASTVWADRNRVDVYRTHPSEEHLCINYQRTFKYNAEGGGARDARAFIILMRRLDNLTLLMPSLMMQTLLQPHACGLLLR